MSLLIRFVYNILIAYFDPPNLLLKLVRHEVKISQKYDIIKYILYFPKSYPKL